MKNNYPLPKVLAHRGAHANAPENTLRAFEAARTAGIKWLEFDVMLTKDGIPIVFHDDHLEELTDGCGLVADHTLAQLKQLTVKRRADDQKSADICQTEDKIPTLAECLAYFKNTELAFNLEIKANKLGDELTCERVLAVLNTCAHFARLVQQHQVSISSFSRDVIAFFAKYAPNIPRAYLIDEHHHDAITFADLYHCVSVNFCSQMPKAIEFLEHALAANMPTLCFTVNSLHEAQDWLARGVKGFFTNNVDCYHLAQTE